MTENNGSATSADRGNLPPDIDLAEIRRKRILKDIGAELHYSASVLEAMGCPTMVAVAALMDGFRANHPRLIGLTDEPGLVAQGFAAAMVIATANEGVDDDDA